MRGGKRTGAGRKSLGERATITVRLTDNALDILRILQVEWNKSQSGVIEDLLLIQE